MKLQKLFLALACGGAVAAGAAENISVVADFAQPESRGRITANDATLSSTTSVFLRVTTKARASWPGVNFRPLRDTWDFSQAQ